MAEQNVTNDHPEKNPSWTAHDQKRDAKAQYALYSIFKRPLGGTDIDNPEEAVKLFEDVVESYKSRVTVRGVYDVSNFRAGADLLVWVHGSNLQDIQALMRDIRKTPLFAGLEPTWQVGGVHVIAEFNRMHAPAFQEGHAPRKWITIYPFVRKADWYLMDNRERALMLREHGSEASKFTNVLANTVAAFAMSDYEWMLAFESDDPTELVELMRTMRYTKARMYMKNELPFHFGRRIEYGELPVVLRYL